ncbi:sodium-dependent phosphate transport protein 2B-like [Oppia nitens]|uniref:sodium-dependent phosphate transport protein 2B-like n=1 Tax=Oppia nitens TaxID=1686743 RepID=UPI0023DA0E0B|nr:sodium-dependent phosphate transport protein 2B-like [Oppia nitens]
MGFNKNKTHLPEDSLNCSPEHNNLIVVDNMMSTWSPNKTNINSEMEPKSRFGRIVTNILKIIALIILLYFFICSLDFLSSAFRLVGSRAVGRIIADSELLKNPVVGLMIGVLVTVLVQSSSTSTSIVVTMVGSHLIKVRNAIPIVMGANIGTSVTNTIVSLMQATDRNEFRLAFAAATVHDMFNWLTVIVLLPLEVSTHYLEIITDNLIQANWERDTNTNTEFLGRLTKPFTKLIIELDKKVLAQITSGHESSNVTQSLIKKGNSLFYKFNLSDTIAGIVLLALSLVVLCVCLVLMVKLLHSMLKGQIAVVIKKTMNREYQFPYSILVDYLAILVGCILTILVQSSSIFTSALTPLAGIGVISLERMYPLTLGSNIGTTTTGLLAALAADSSSLKSTLQLAFCHLFFNISGILLFYPIPFMRWPIGLARMLGNITAKYRWFSVFYLVMMFFLLPLTVFALSMTGTWTLIIIGGPVLLVFFIAIVINLIQRKKPNLLPLKLQNWNFLPLWMHSLEPIDEVIAKCVERCSCLACCVGSQSRHDAPALAALNQNTNQSQLHILGQISNSNSSTQLKHIYENDGYILHWESVRLNQQLNDKEVTNL